MSDAFGPLARRLAGLSARLLGWSAGQFWHATPEELATVLEAGDELAPGTPPDPATLTRMMKDHPDG